MPDNLACSRRFSAATIIGLSTIFPSRANTPDPAASQARNAAINRIAWAISSSEGEKARLIGSTWFNLVGVNGEFACKTQLPGK